MGIKQEFGELDGRLAAPKIISRQTYQVPGETSLENIPKKFGRGTGFTTVLPKIFKYFGAGTYPKSYNPKVHGPYYPHRYYGKADTAFSEVKIGELGAWLSRREKGLRPFNMLMSRAYWRFMNAHFTARPGLYVLYAAWGAVFAMRYIWQDGRFSNYTHAKYH